MNFKLPYGIEIYTTCTGAGAIQSNLGQELVPAEQGDEDERRVQVHMEGWVDGVESLLVALASAGIDMNDMRISEAIKVAVEGAANNLD